MKVLVVRHWQTDWNVIGRVQGQTDIELNDEGRKQAEVTGNNIGDKRIDLIISSPLKRARETADIINKSFNVNIIEDKRLMERNYGKSEGLTKDEIRELKKEYPEIEEVWDYQKNTGVNGIEKMQDFCSRVYEFLNEIKEKYKNKRVLLVTHGGTSIPIQCYYKKYPLEQIKDRSVIKSLKNCEVAMFEEREDIER